LHSDKREEQRKAYLAALPGFLSQVLLLINSGMILETAMHRIAEGWEGQSETGRSLFAEEMVNLHRISLRTGENMVKLFYRFGRTSGVRELMRASSIMMDNLDKGTDLWEKLAAESDMLWQERKRMALEQMRIGESKMSFPLGLLLMALLLVTAAPALMQIS